MREKLLGSGPLGQGGGVAGAHTDFAPVGPYYLINDTFTTDLAAGAVNGTDAEPGPGRRVVTDTNNKLSLSGGYASFATGGVGAGDPGLWYQGMARDPGRLMICGLTYDSLVGFQAGWDVNAVTAISNGFNASGANLRLRSVSVGSFNVGTLVDDGVYNLCVILRAAGVFCLIKGEVFTNWTLMPILGSDSDAIIYPSFGVNSVTNVWRGAYLRVPATRWLPTPIVSDGFGGDTLGADGLGHAEGVAGGLGAGGDLYGWLFSGTWANSAGVSNASALSGGSAIAYIDCSVANVIATVKLTRSGGDGGLLLRFVDGNNFISCRHDGTNVILVKKVAGANTTVLTSAATYVAGAELRVACEGTKFRVFYNNAAVGGEQTISDAALQSGTSHGRYTTNTGNTFDDFTVYARGSGGEYAILDTF